MSPIASLPRPVFTSVLLAVAWLLELFLQRLSNDSRCFTADYDSDAEGNRAECMRVKAFSATVPKQDLLQKEPPALATICFSTGLCLVRYDGAPHRMLQSISRLPFMPILDYSVDQLQQADNERRQALSWCA